MPKGRKTKVVRKAGSIMLIQAKVDKKLVAKLDNIARLLHMNRSEAIEVLLETAVESNEFAESITKKFLGPLQRFIAEQGARAKAREK